MKLGTFTHGGVTRIGVAAGDTIIDLAAEVPELPREMIAFLAAGPAWQVLRRGEREQRG